MPVPRALLERVEREHAPPPPAPTLDLASVLFGPQLDFVRDPASFAEADCSRRAGKTVGIAAWLLEGPLLQPDAPSLYLTKTRGSAKRIIWSTLLKLNKEHGLGYEVNEADLVLKRDGIGSVYLAGVDTKTEIEKARGSGWGRVAIDEAQSLPAHVKELVEDVLMPALMDHDGRIRLLGTPGAVKAGYFWDVSQNPDWAHHKWTVWDNPHIPEANKRKLLERTLKARGVTIDHPGIRREFFGEWAYDPDALVFRFDPATNTFDELPKCRAPWEYVIGVDLGFNDADAIAVLAFNRESPLVFVTEEWVGTKQLPSELAARLGPMVERLDPAAVVMDEGGLGKKIAEEFRRRWSLPIKAAEKSRKFEFIELVNDALRTGRLKARKRSRFGEDAMKIEWDRDRSTNDRPVVSERFHSDIADAVLYAFRESLHWTHQESPKRAKPNTPEWFADEERRALERAEAESRQASEDAWIGDEI